MTNNFQEEKPVSYSLPGALCIFVTKTEDNSVEYFKNLDGFRICPETGDIHAIQFLVDRWEKIILKGYQFRAARSIRGNPEEMSSHQIDYFYSQGTKKLQGIKISNSLPFGDVTEVEYSYGIIDNAKSIVETVHYNAGIKSPKLVFQLVFNEIVNMPPERRDYNFWKGILNNMKEIYEI